MLVKYSSEITPDESKKLRSELHELTNQEREIKQSLADVKATADNELKYIQTIRSEIQRIQALFDESDMKVRQQQSEIAGLENEIKITPIKKSNDVIQDDKLGEENYLLGLRVEGSRIGFLFDSSSSMTDEKLIDVIRRKAGSDKIKQQGPKWQRAKRVMRWLLARLPKESKASVVSFNNTSTFLGESSWFSAAQGGQIGSIYADMDMIIPSGPTNLHSGLQKLKSLKPNISDLYVITDGLPTTGMSNYAGLNPFSKCSSLLGRATTISGECRVKLFRQTIKEAALGANVRVNVILLPIEGDPEAAPEFWNWTASSGGLLISPAESWP
ncbi:MAG: hypothetical protein V7731_05755 [Amphritea sp.]